MPWFKLALLAALTPVVANAAADWPSYNKTLTSERFADLDQINTRTVAGLKVVCTYDTKQMVAFQTGLVQTGGAIFATTETDTFAIDPNTCAEKWRVHETFKPGYLKVNRGLAYLGGRVFRGTTDGRVLAFDAKTGKKLWARSIADAAKGESIPAAPIAWNGLVFVGNAGGDNKGVKGRMYALDAATGKIAWEFYLVPKAAGDPMRGPQGKGAPGALGESWKNPDGTPITGGGTWTSYTLDPASGLLYVPGGNPAPDFVKSLRPGDNLFTGSVVVLDAKTGAYRNHFQLVKNDFHDWDVSTAPSVFTNRNGARVMAVAPKDGHLYGFDLKTGAQMYRQPVTTISNVDAPLTAAGTRFCPGSQGGAEWNGPAYDPTSDLILTGEVDWCATVQIAPNAAVQSVAMGQAWSGSGDKANAFGKLDPQAKWAGWMTATNAATGVKAWSFKAPAPLMGGVTPTAGGVTLFGDMAGNFYAFDTKAGAQLWSQNLGGAVAGGVITYDTGAGQKVAVAAGMTSPIWPTQKVTGRIVVLGL